MAEFREVMRQINRMCSHYSNCEDSGCPLFDECGNLGAYSSNEKQAERIERAVSAWAAEHPEPIYPTWYEWLKNMGLTFHDAESSWIGFTERIHHSIPADIAQKLRVEPKNE